MEAKPVASPQARSQATPCVWRGTRGWAACGRSERDAAPPDNCAGHCPRLRGEGGWGRQTGAGNGGERGTAAGGGGTTRLEPPLRLSSRPRARPGPARRRPGPGGGQPLEVRERVRHHSVHRVQERLPPLRAEEVSALRREAACGRTDRRTGQAGGSAEAGGRGSETIPALSAERGGESRCGRTREAREMAGADEARTERCDAARRELLVRPQAEARQQREEAPEKARHLITETNANAQRRKFRLHPPTSPAAQHAARRSSPHAGTANAAQECRARSHPRGPDQQRKGRIKLAGARSPGRRTGRRGRR